MTETIKQLKRLKIYHDLNGGETKAIDNAIRTLETYRLSYNMGYEAGVSAVKVCRDIAWEERIDAIKADIDKQTEIHSDGEFYIKNIDVKRIIDKHCGGDKG